MTAFLLYLAIAFRFVYAAERMATRQHRSRKGWMWATALLGPFVPSDIDLPAAEGRIRIFHKS
jgi:hypothetical protein